jgi:hypothetical protein
MRTILAIIAIFICAAIIITGNNYWHKKTKVNAYHDVVKDVSRSPVKRPIESPTKSVSASTEESTIEKLTAKWPVEAQNTFKEKRANHEKFKIAFVGSQDLGVTSNGWSIKLKNEMLARFGDDILDVQIFEYDDITSLHFYQEKKFKEVGNSKADLVLLEPFILNDNGKVSLSDNHDIILKTIAYAQTQNSQTSFILQPSHPIYKATIYPEQVKKLKEFAKEQHIMYLDHWQVWPESSDESIKKYLLDDQSAPNDKGSILWADFLADQLISQ